MGSFNSLYTVWYSLVILHTCSEIYMSFEDAQKGQLDFLHTTDLQYILYKRRCNRFSQKNRIYAFLVSPFEAHVQSIRTYFT
jgi:hypothetical protein